MKTTFLSLFSFFTIAAFAGPPGSGGFDFISHQSTFNLAAGRYDADFNALNQQLRLWGSPNVFPTSYYMVGTTSTKGDGTDYGKWDASTSLEFMLPNEIAIGPHDSLTFRMYGWHFMSSAFGKDLIPGDAVALVVAPGIDWGSTKLKRTLNGGEGKYKNPFVAPLARADLRFVFGKLSIGARALYRYDITHSIWKRKTDNLPVLPGSKMTGLGFQVFIGFGKTD